jgi:excinuclease ABC subunit C
VGPKRRKLLIDQFESLQGIRDATVEEIASVPGIPVEVAESVKANLD